MPFKGELNQLKQLDADEQNQITGPTHYTTRRGIAYQGVLEETLWDNGVPQHGMWVAPYYRSGYSGVITSVRGRKSRIWPKPAYPMDLRKWYTETGAGSGSIQVTPGWPRYIAEVVAHSGIAEYALGLLPSLPTHLVIPDVYKQTSLQQVQAAAKSPSIALGPFFGEIEQTFELLMKPAKAVRIILGKRYAKALQKRIVGKRLDRYLADWWLEYRYGVMPLALDIDSALKEVDRVRREALQTFRSSAKFPHMEPIYGGGSFDVSYFRFYYSTKVTYKRKVGSGIMMKFGSGSDLGTDLHEYPSRTWELIPFSFVLDWFITVGDAFQNITPNHGKLYSDWLTSLSETVLELKILSAQRRVGDWTVHNDLYGSYARYREFHMQREINNSQITWPLPAKGLNFVRTADAIGLSLATISNVAGKLLSAIKKR